MILKIKSKNVFNLVLEQTKHLTLKLDASYKTKVYEHYQGSYIISPKVTSQIMETKDKLMDDDVNIKEIYINETENESGGLTVQIGEI